MSSWISICYKDPCPFDWAEADVQGDVMNYKLAVITGW